MVNMDLFHQNIPLLYQVLQKFNISCSTILNTPVVDLVTLSTADILKNEILNIYKQDQSRYELNKY